MPEGLTKREYFQGIVDELEIIIPYLDKAKKEADDLTEYDHNEFDVLHDMISQIKDIAKSMRDKADQELDKCIKEDRDFQERNWRVDV